MHSRALLILAALASAGASASLGPNAPTSGPAESPSLPPAYPPAPPCHQVFRYEPSANPGSSTGWVGVVRLLAPPRFAALHLTVHFAAPQHLPPEPPPGTLSLRGGVAAGRELVRATQQGRSKVVEFVADFSCAVTAVPTLLNVTVNGLNFCTAMQEPADTLSTISLVADMETGLGGASTGEDDFRIVPDSVWATTRGGDAPTGTSLPCPAAPTGAINTPSVSSSSANSHAALTPRPPPPAEAAVPQDLVRPSMYILPALTRAPPDLAPPPPRQPARPAHGVHAEEAPRPPPPVRAKPAPTSPPLTAAHDDTHDNNEDCGRASSAAANPLVTRGATAARGRWPWLVALFKKLGRRDQVGLNFECGGSLVSRRHVVTAAHCVEMRGKRGRPVDAASLVVFLGKHDLLSYTEPGQQTAEVDAVRMHPDYGRSSAPPSSSSSSSSSFENDIALLVLSDSVASTKHIRPVCLWDAVQGGTDVETVVGNVGAVPGWGKDDTGAISNEIRVANMPIVSQEVCLRSNVFYHAFTSSTTFCAGFRNGTSVCNGDSGGGLYLKEADGRWRIRGIVSVSMFSVNEQSCDSYNYAVFTDVAKFMPWLDQEMNAQ